MKRRESRIVNRQSTRNRRSRITKSKKREGGNMSWRLVKVVFVLGCVLIPGIAAAQTATIAGVARDSSGAVLPGVTVEVASPALIEKTRSAVTDDAGQYRVVDLRPGTYTVTFTLQG